MFRRLGLMLAGTLTTLVVLTPAATAAPPIATIAHRGASAYAPENTIAAFELADDQRADMFEIDVQETRDHKLILMHDTTLARTTNVEQVFPDRAPWRVADHTLAEIRKLDAGSWFAPKHKGEAVPTLGETLRAMRSSGLRLLLEVKEPRLYPGIETRIAAELRRNSAWSGKVVVQSFDWDSMRAVNQLLPKVPIGLLGTPSTGELADLAEFADLINPPYGDVTDDYVELVHDHDMKIYPWTVDEPTAMLRMISYGVDGIITNKPDVLHDLT